MPILVIGAAIAANPQKLYAEPESHNNIVFDVTTGQNGKLQASNVTTI